METGGYQAANGHWIETRSKTENTTIKGRPAILEYTWASEYERGAPAEWRCCIWQDGEILASGAGQTAAQAGEDAWYNYNTAEDEARESW